MLSFREFILSEEEDLGAWDTSFVKARPKASKTRAMRNPFIINKPRKKRIKVSNIFDKKD